MATKQPALASGSILLLLQNASATGTSPSLVWQGGAGIFIIEATWGGGTASLQVQSPNGTWIAVAADTTFTANGLSGFILPPGVLLRVSVTTATAVFASIIIS